LGETGSTGWRSKVGSFEKSLDFGFCKIGLVIADDISGELIEGNRFGKARALGERDIFERTLGNIFSDNIGNIEKFHVVVGGGGHDTLGDTDGIVLVIRSILIRIGIDFVSGGKISGKD